MKRYIFAALIGVVAIASIAAIANARPRGPRPDGMPQRGMMGMHKMEALDLTDAQKEKLQALRIANAKAMARLQADAKIAQIELREVLQQDTPKTADVKAKVAVVNKVRGQILEARTLHGIEMKQVLTPEQRKKLETLRAQRRRWGMRNPQGMQNGQFGPRRGMKMRRGGPVMPQEDPKTDN